MRPLASVVLATYQRGHLLESAIAYGYNQSRFPLERLELIVVDDGSLDRTPAICLDQLDHRIDLKYIRLRKEPDRWRDCAAVINVGIRAASGERIILTHPEVIPGRDSIAACCDAQDDEYTACKVYYLLPEFQKNFLTVDWVEKGALAARDFAGFYDPAKYVGGNPDYTPLSMDARSDWHSWVFGSFTRKGMKRLGGMIETEKWGSVDITLYHRRRMLGFRDITCLDPSTIVVHQNHDIEGNVKTDRDEAAWKKEVDQLCLNPDNAGYPSVDHLW